MYLLDTDTLTHLQAGNTVVLARLQSLPDLDFGITIINRIEILRGRFDFLLKAATREELLRAQSLLIRTDELLARFPVVSLNDAAISHFDPLNHTKGISKIGGADCPLDSTAIT